MPAPARRLGMLALLGVLAAPPLQAQAGTLSGTGAVSINASRNSRMGVTVLAGGTQSIASVTPNAINPFPSPVQVRVEWDLSAFSGTISLVAFFSAPASALVSGPNAIPAGRVEARMTSGGLPAFTPVNAAGVGGVGTAGGSRVLWTQNACRFFFFFLCDGDRTDNLDLRLNLTGLALPVGTYTGTLNLRAVTY